MDINFLVGNASVNTGSRDVEISGANAAFVSAACAMFIAGAPTPVEAVSGSLTTIKLRNPWPYASITNSAFVAFNTLEGLANLMRRFATLVDQSIGVSTNFATILQSVESTVVIDLEEGDDITVVPYGYLVANVQALISELQESTELFEQLQVDVGNLTTSVAEQQQVVDTNLNLALGYKNEAQTAASETLANKNEVVGMSSTITVLAAKVSTDAGLADSSRLAAETSAANALDSATVAGNHLATVVAAKNSAEQAATNAGQSESNSSSNSLLAQEAAAEAVAKANLAASSADSAAQDKNLAAIYAQAAESSNSEASNSATEAHQSELNAEKWAVNPENAEVVGGLYSALHYSQKAQGWASIAQAAAGTVTGAMSYNGDHSAATGVFPPTPDNGSAIYRISASGVIAGTAFRVNDFIIYDGNSTAWYLLSRNGLVIADVGGLQAQLDAKASASVVSALSTSIVSLTNRVSAAENQMVTLNENAGEQSTAIQNNLNAISVLSSQVSRVRLLALAGL
jgi:hypothetical protein